METRPGPIRKTWDWVGHIHLVSWLADLVVHGWTYAVSGAAATLFGRWAFISHYGALPVALVALFVFVAAVWSLNGLVWLNGQRRPSRARIKFDYTWGLAVDNVVPGLDLENKQNTLEFRMIVRNATNGPIRVHLKTMTVTIEDRFYTFSDVSFVLSMGGSTTVIPDAGFDSTAYSSFKDRTVGTLTYEAEYGHPSDRYARVSARKLELHVFKHRTAVPRQKPTQAVIVNWLLREETDEAI